MPGLQRYGNLHVRKSVLAGTTPVLIPLHLPYGIPYEGLNTCTIFNINLLKKVHMCDLDLTRSPQHLQIEFSCATSDLPYPEPIKRFTNNSEDGTMIYCLPCKTTNKEQQNSCRRRCITHASDCRWIQQSKMTPKAHKGHTQMRAPCTQNGWYVNRSSYEEAGAKKTRPNKKHYLENVSITHNIWSQTKNNWEMTQ